jgi:hypothetical protein
MFISRFSRIRPNLPDLVLVSYFIDNDSASVFTFFRTICGDSVLVHCRIATYLCRISSNSYEMCSLDKSLSKNTKIPGKIWSATIKQHWIFGSYIKFHTGYKIGTILSVNHFSQCQYTPLARQARSALILWLTYSYTAHRRSTELL